MSCSAALFHDKNRKHYFIILCKLAWTTIITKWIRTVTLWAPCMYCTYMKYHTCCCVFMTVMSHGSVFPACGPYFHWYIYIYLQALSSLPLCPWTSEFPWRYCGSKFGVSTLLMCHSYSGNYFLRPNFEHIIAGWHSLDGDTSMTE